MRPPSISDRPALNPGMCYKCRSGPEAGNRTYYVDLGIDVDYEGVMYLCNFCLADVIKCGVPDIMLQKDVHSLISESQNSYVNSKKKLAELELVKKYMTSIGIDFDTMLTAAKEKEVMVTEQEASFAKYTGSLEKDLAVTDINIPNPPDYTGKPEFEPDIQRMMQTKAFNLNDDGTPSTPPEEFVMPVEAPPLEWPGEPIDTILDEADDVDRGPLFSDGATPDGAESQPVDSSGESVAASSPATGEFDNFLK